MAALTGNSSAHHSGYNQRPERLHKCLAGRVKAVRCFTKQTNEKRLVRMALMKLHVDAMKRRMWLALLLHAGPPPVGRGPFEFLQSAGCFQTVPPP